ncbi:hypothetical protein HNY73_004588 [Argiope bruennichi]|uniref:Uncharacterized protein n=1 Tax=Argiope bruennichi TaxID=94029 RepID=A0A8T0FTQ8_ARGBR|nr:hypothetical protein HNY73_004588 [Argiope bruennichi]
MDEFSKELQLKLICLVEADDSESSAATFLEDKFSRIAGTKEAEAAFHSICPHLRYGWGIHKNEAFHLKPTNLFSLAPPDSMKILGHHLSNKKEKQYTSLKGVAWYGDCSIFIPVLRAMIWHQARISSRPVPMATHRFW